jgi:hypothetical protein
MNTSRDNELLTLNIELSELMERETVTARFIELVEDMVVLYYPPLTRRSPDISAHCRTLPTVHPTNQHRGVGGKPVGLVMSGG